MREFDVLLHLGVHKTASTHLQKSLRTNEAFCTRVSVKFLPTIEYRKFLSPLEIQLKNGGDLGLLSSSYQEKIKSEANEHQRLILSDENIMVLALPLGEKGLYPNSINRIRRTRKLIGPEPIKVYLSVRNLGSYLPSVYVEFIRHFKYISFAQFLAMAKIDNLSWFSLVKRIRNILSPSDTLSVWTYESYAKSHDFVYMSLLNVDDLTGFEPLQSKARAGLSAQAVYFVEEAIKVGKIDRAKKLIIEAQNKFPRGRLDQAYQPLSINQINLLSENYKRDLAGIDSCPGIQFLG